MAIRQINTLQGLSDPAARFIEKHHLAMYLPLAEGLVRKHFEQAGDLRWEYETDPELPDQWLSLYFTVEGEVNEVVDNYDMLADELGQKSALAPPRPDQLPVRGGVSGWKRESSTSLRSVLPPPMGKRARPSCGRPSTEPITARTAWASSVSVTGTSHLAGTRTLILRCEST